MSFSPFFFIMAFAATLSLMRGFLIAAAVSPQNFGYYAALVAVGAFSSNILGWGRIEATRKNFTRQWLDGNAHWVVSAADKLAKTLVVRAVIAGVVLSLPIALNSIDIKWLVFLVCSILVTVAVGWMSIYSSAVRASGNINAMGYATLVRAILALLLGVSAAFTDYWELIIASEVLAAIVGAWLSRKSTVQAAVVSPCIPIEEKNNHNDSTGGRWLFYAFLASSAPLYLDKLFVASQFSPAELGRYSFMMLFVMGSATISGIVEQVIGPQQIRLQRENSPLNSQLFLALRWMLAQGALVAAGMLLAMWVLVDGPLVVLGDRYQIDSEIIFYTLFLCMFQTSILLDWLLISRDQEKKSFYAALCYMLIVVMILLIVELCNLPLTTLIGFLACAKVAHVILLILASLSKSRSFISR